MREFTYNTSQQAWEEMNKRLVRAEMLKIGSDHDIKILKNQVILYDIMIRVNKSYIDPNFDFTKTVNYRSAKWTGLVSNYVDKNHLEEVVAAVKHRELRKNKNYNESFHFGNSHGHGKGCLLICTFSRRHGDDRPILNAVMRASEFYKRGMMDLMLLHRIGELVYGEESFGLNIFAQQLWGGSDWLSMIACYDKEFIKDCKDGTDFEREVYKKYRQFMDTEDIDALTYNAYKRACRVIQGVTATPSLLAKDCYLY